LGPVGQLVAEVGDGAEGAAMTVGGIPPERAGDAAGKFQNEFERKLGPPPQPYAVYAAQAAQVALDAIAASDGTRAGVRRRVLATHVDGGILGSFSFASTGEITPAPVTIIRVRNGRAAIERVLGSGVP
jgi:ABC-type branched-subunit amino acid transport system substrate-binding protein